ncbi:hypothetical protein V1514DRAFT_115285 [Lipomyces japonicus]|uniref:uncharacterized protein n=1 Tax=Lipomyces japonicus TaxID=56871 RepID=UPI0034D01A13
MASMRTSVTFSRSIFRSWGVRVACTRSLATAAASNHQINNAPSPVPSDKPTLYDVVIVGGGVSGLTLAAGLKSSPHTAHLKTALIESLSLDTVRNWDAPLSQFSNRVSSFTPSNKAYLESIGVWNHVYQERVQEYDGMKVWDGVSGARIEFDSFSLTDGGSIAYMIENLNLQQALLSKLVEHDGITVIDSTKVEKIEHGEDHGDVDLRTWPTLQLSNGDKIGARLLVGADGINSPVRAFAGIKSRGWDYNQHGVVATLTLEWDDRQRIAWQRFLPSGPIALLPMPDGKASLVWSTTPEHAAHLKQLSSSAFCALVNAAFRLGTTDINYLLSRSDENEVGQEFEWRDEQLPIEAEGHQFPIRVVEVNDRASFPLRLRHCDTYVGSRIVLVGDAAHTTHPLAGQGLNLGQADVQQLITVLEFAVKRGSDIGDEVVLQEYWADRYPANHVTLGIVDKLQKLYSTDCAPVVAVRSAGLEIVESLPWLKKFIMTQAGTGINGGSQI